MIKITKARGFLDNESYRKEIREEGKYYPEISASTQIVWNGSNISYNGEYTIIEGYEIPSDRHLKELSDEFEPSIYDSIKSDNNELY